MNRREFITGAVAAVGVTGYGKVNEPKGRILFGACRPMKDAALMKSIGYDFIEGTVADCFAPDKGEEEWKRLRDLISALPIPLRSCNNFIPGKFRLTGPKAEFAPALAYAEIALRRAEEAGVKYVVFGSNGARNVPGDPCGKPDERPKTEEGFEQYIEFCRQLTARVKDLKSVEILVEPLRPNGANFLNYVWQGMQVVEDVNSPRLNAMADIFHMMAGREPARSIIEAGSHLKHCHIADWATRDYPGERPETVFHMKPYFEALKTIGYAGGVSCETGIGGWGKDSDLAKNLETSLKTLRNVAT